MTYEDARNLIDRGLLDADGEVSRLRSALGDAEMQVADRDAQLEELRAAFDAYKAAHPDGDPPPPPPPPPTDTMLLGSSMSRYPHPGPLDYDRCYNEGDVDDAVRNHQAKRVALTFDDDPKDPAVVVSRLKAIRQKYPTLLIDFAHENEVDRHRAGDIPAWAREHKAIQDAIHAAFPDGTVLVAADFTAFNIRNGTAEKFMLELQRIGCKLDIFAFSAYPAGRQKKPAVETPMSEHIDVGVNLAAKYGIKRVAVWEIGTPVSSAYDRPTLVAKWPPHFRDAAEAKGLIPVGMIYWDSGDPLGIDNRWQNDAPKTQNAFLRSLDAA